MKFIMSCGLCFVLICSSIFSLQAMRPSRISYKKNRKQTRSMPIFSSAFDCCDKKLQKNQEPIKTVANVSIPTDRPCVNLYENFINLKAQEHRSCLIMLNLTASEFLYRIYNPYFYENDAYDADLHDEIVEKYQSSYAKQVVSRALQVSRDVIFIRACDEFNPFEDRVMRKLENLLFSCIAKDGVEVIALSRDHALQIAVGLVKMPNKIVIDLSYQTSFLTDSLSKYLR